MLIEAVKRLFSSGARVEVETRPEPALSREEQIAAVYEWRRRGAPLNEMPACLNDPFFAMPNERWEEFL